MGDAQPADDKPNNEPEEVDAKDVPSLDNVHERTVDQLDNEPDTEGGDDDGSDAGDGKDTSKPDDKPAEGADDKPTDDDGAGSGDDKPADGADDTPEPAPAEPTPSRPEPAPKLDQDIEKPGEGKIAVKNFDGKTYYFNDLDEVPNDFEPESYKAWGVAVDRFTRKSLAEESDKAAEEQRLVDETTKGEIKAMQEGWDGEIKTLTDNKVLPEDPKEREKVTQGVFEYMGERLAAGVIIDSWEEAYKGWSFEQTQKQDDEDQQVNNDKKKKRGALVQAGGTPAPSKPKVIEGPPPGVSLDQVHERALRNM